MKNILIVNHYSGNDRVGMEYRHRYLSRYFTKSGFSVTIASGSFSHLYSKPPALAGGYLQERDGDLNQIWIKTPTYSGNGIKRLLNMIVYSLKLIFLTLRGKLGKPDYVICSTPHPFVVLNLLVFKIFCRSKTIFEVRDIWPLMLVELGQIGRYNPLSMVFSMLERLGYKFANATVSLWSHAKAYSVGAGVKENKYFYIPNGIEISEVEKTYDNDACRLVDELHAKGYFVVGYGGSHGLANPMDQVIDAAKITSDSNKKIAYVMVGSGPAKESAVERSASLNLDNIFWLPPESKKDIMGFYSKLDACFIGLKSLPLFKYGPTPNKLMDYMLAAKPIIFSIDTPYNPIKLAGCGVFAKPDCGRALFDAAMALKDCSASERDNMGAAGKKFAEENLSYESLAEKYIEVFKEID